ncbi:MAG: ATP-binding cassette domain-containing protein [Pseudomonadota bacterium]
MALISLRDVCWGFGDPPLLENITLQIEKGDRIALVGRNGVGKSTLMRLLSGKLQPDSGDMWRQQGLTVATLAQEVPENTEGTVFDVVAGFGDDRPADTGHHWEVVQRIEITLSQTGLDPKKRFSELSAGMKRRTLFARAMAQAPDLLLLDEPTNHLDIATIEWMESFILRHVRTLLCVTHDRAFLKHIATGIMDLDRGRLTVYACDYDTFVSRRQADLDADANRQRREDKKLAEEEAWIRQGVKARRTRNEGRVRELQKMRAAVASRRRKTGDVRLQVQEAERTGRLVIEASGVDISWGGAVLVDGLSTVVMRGDRVGIIGPNGSGKTSLLRVLLKEAAPSTGSVRHGTHLQVAYFDQLRAQLDPDKTVAENIGEGNDFIIFNGEKRHVIGYLQDFLFTPERCRTPVRVLSGGEKNRLLLARLFTLPANVLVMDEPTNDLDAETLDLLEELLFQFKGTLLLVSHDRAFLNNVVTSTLVFEGGGRVTEYAGGYDDWLAQRPQPAASTETTARPRPAPKPAPPQKPRKLGYLQQRELDGLPARIEALEAEHAIVGAALSDPSIYRNVETDFGALSSRLAELESEILAAYERWEELEGKVDSAS